MRQVSSCGKFVLHFRLRHGLSQQRMADLLGIQPRRLAAWERGEGEPGPDTAGRLIDLLHRLPSELMGSLSGAIVASGLPRALSRTSQLNLQALSGPAIDKRPNIVEWIGQDLAPIACGVLETMLGDVALQRDILKREISSVVTTTRSVLRTDNSLTVGLFRTTINYFFHDGVLFSDAIAVPAHDDERIGFTPIPVEEMGFDLFGDHYLLEAAMAATLVGPARRRRG